LQENSWLAIVLWLNEDDGPGLGRLKLLGRKPKPRLVSSYLLMLLENLNPQSLVVNVFRPLLAENESQITKNVEQWVDNLHQEPLLDSQTEEKLIGVILQLIEQKFKELTYKELSQMLRLVPLAETTSGQELVKDENVSILTQQARRKLGVSEELAEAVSMELQK